MRIEMPYDERAKAAIYDVLLAEDCAWILESDPESGMLAFVAPRRLAMAVLSKLDYEQIPEIEARRGS